ncbi:FAD-binding domain-containing protein [Buchnera aphidicola (Periphyllus koelreuteriae)]|uniref:cryptochrome/photolyase family protein n=1 Tax=Buchnera aphidicola TaxID=9 RepID=UPI0031B80950
MDYLNMTSLIWLRNDLRIDDNKALYYACKKKKDIIVLFISTPKQWKNHSMSGKQANFIYNRLLYLQKKFFSLNINFLYKEAKDFNKSIKCILLICKKYKISSVFYNFQYEFNEKKRDDLLKINLLNNKIKVYNFHDNILVSPNLIKNNLGNSYKIFYFFKKKILNILKNKKIICVSQPKIRKKLKILNKKNINFRFKFKKFNITKFPFKDKLIIKKINYFFKNKFFLYNKKKDYLYLNNTSEFSIYLNLGVFSVRKFFYYILKYSKNNYKNSYILLNKLLWREFFKHLMFSYQNLSKNLSLKPFEKKIKWKNNHLKIKAWKKGLTGVPIIDAGMRQLKKTGWLNNRLRMIVSNFLVKNLLINWRIGEKHFMLNLIDSDFSINNGNWQWISSCGTDSVSYIRTFNPYIQSKKFDNKGIFIKKYVKELKNVPIKNIHKPYLWLKKNEPYTKYPKPIINYEKNKKIFEKIIKKLI